jgi:hypothetical protein
VGIFYSPPPPDRPRVHPASYQMVTRGPFSEDKTAVREADHSPPSSTEVKNAWSYTSTPRIGLHGVVFSLKIRRQVYLTLNIIQ